jgi:hypothetical protein
MNNEQMTQIFVVVDVVVFVVVVSGRLAKFYHVTQGFERA